MASNTKYKRNLDDVYKIINHAKLDEQTLLPVTQAIYFADITKEYKLLELNAELVDKLNSGVELFFRGCKDEKAVLCSDNRTYEVKEAETSNSLLVIPNLEFPDEIKLRNNSDMLIDHKNVLGVFHTYLELKVCKPKFKKLRLLLEESLYRGPELESELIESRVNMYSSSDILMRVQASEAEVMQALKDLFAFELDNKWRILELDYHCRILGYLLSLIDQQSWKIDEIPVTEIFELLDELLPPKILKHLVSMYIIDSYSQKKLETAQQLGKLNTDLVNRTLGHWFLKTCRQMEFNEFMKTWRETNPLGLAVDIKQLDGLFYIVQNGNQKVIHYCPENELSEDISERIQYLFNLKMKWTFEEIRPFIQSFATDKMDVNAILTKYARVSKSSNGVRLYSSRHGK